MKKISIVPLLFISYLVSSQNIVPNSSFEIMRVVPDDNNRGISCAEGWFCPSGTIGDYYNKASLNKLFGIPENSMGYQEPHTGDGYAGICIESGMVEYIETKLADTLIKGKSYVITFYVSRADKRSGYVNEFGIAFSDKLEYFSEENGITEKPTIDFVNKKGFKDQTGWTKVSTVYVAEGYELVIILGFFNHLNPKKRINKTHYYIDDISIVPIDEIDTTR